MYQQNNHLIRVWSILLSTCLLTLLPLSAHQLRVEQNGTLVLSGWLQAQVLSRSDTLYLVKEKTSFDKVYALARTPEGDSLLFTSLPIGHPQAESTSAKIFLLYF